MDALNVKRGPAGYYLGNLMQLLTYPSVASLVNYLADYGRRFDMTMNFCVVAWCYARNYQRKVSSMSLSELSNCQYIVTMAQAKAV